MDWLSSFLKLEHKHYKPIMFGISVFLGTVAAGFLIIFQFKPELVEKYDIFKLLVFSCALTLPLISINAVITAFLYARLPDDYENETAKNVDITRGAFQLNAGVIYLSLLICHFWPLNFRYFFWMIVVLEMLMVFGSMLVWHMLKTDNKFDPRQGGAGGCGG
jgi:hypothetical protein